MAWDILLLALKLFWRRIGLLLAANVIWLGLSLLIIPWPAATAGLFYLIKRIVAEELDADPPLTPTMRDFWDGMRQHWLRGSIAAVGDLLALVLIVVALVFYARSPEPLRWLIGPIFLVGVVWAGCQLYFFPLLLQREGQSLWAVAREAFQITLTNAINTFSLLLTALIITVGATLLAGPILLVLFSFIAMLQTIALHTVLVKRGEITLRVVPELRADGVRKPRKGPPR